MKFIDLLYPTLLFGIVGVTFAVYRLRAVVVADSERKANSQREQDGLYECAKSLEKVNDYLKSDDPLKAYQLFFEVAAKIRSYRQESFTSIEWKDFLHDTLNNVATYESYFATNHKDVPKWAEMMRKKKEESRMQEAAAFHQRIAIYILAGFLGLLVIIATLGGRH